MCTRTKTSYGCGCAHKRTENCGSRSCSGIARYHLLNQGDCPDCKRGGDRVTRGREGKGRYAQEIKARDAAAPSVTRPPLSPISTNVKASPWAPPRPEEKDWHSPVRKMADEAWLEEHEKRQRDLEAKSKKTSARISCSPSTKDRARDQKYVVKLPDEARKVEDAERLRVRRRAERSHSYDSFYTMDSSASPPRGRTFDSFFDQQIGPYSVKISSIHGLGHGIGSVVRAS